MNIGGGNPKLSSNLKHSKASLKKLYKSRLTYKKSLEEKYFLYVLISIGENHRGEETLFRGGGNPRVPPPPSVSNPARLTGATWKEESALVCLESLIEGWCSG